MHRFSWLGRAVLFAALGSVSLSASAARVQGQLAKWHPIELDFTGPLMSEADDDDNPFLDYRLEVELTSPTGSVYTVAGFFAGDGQGNGRGDQWRARFSADAIGQWHYRAELRQGHEIAVSLDAQAGRALALDGAAGSFDIAAAPQDAPAFLRQGRLEYVGEHYLKFRDGPFWIKGGTDSPENLLGFAGIDGTFDQGGIDRDFLHDFSAHRADWRDGDPLFAHASTGADSRGLIGALNYLAEQGVNSIYFLPMNLGGDGQDTYPFIGAANTRYDKTHYDISKLYQWNQVLAHAQEQGIALNIVLSETEIENERWLDNGELGVERRLFFRELVARFGYLLAVKWNLGEENDFPRVELDKHADYLQAIDWSGKPIAVHTHINQFYRYGEIVGDPRYQATSIQYEPQFAGQFVEQWRSNSANTGHRWVVDMDENTNGLGSNDANVNERRKQVLYDVLFSGGNIEWYFGYYPQPLGGDVDAGNFRLRETMWRQMRYAREMMQDELPFWRMQPADSLISGEADNYGGAEVFALANQAYAIYLPASNGNEQLNLSGVQGLYRQRWFDPRTGQMHEARSGIAGSAQLSLGNPPSNRGDDWVVLLTRTDQPAAEQPQPQQPANGAPRFDNLPQPVVQIGEQFQLTLSATDDDGTFPSVTVGQLPAGMRIHGPGNGLLELSWLVPDNASAQSVVEVIAIDANDASSRTVQTFTITVQGAGEGADAPESGDEGAQTTTADPQPGSDQESAPLINALPVLTVQSGERLSQRVQAYDADGIPPSLILLHAPDTVTLDDNGDGTRTLNWQTTAADVGRHVFTLRAVDHANPALSDSLQIEIQITP